MRAEAELAVLTARQAQVRQRVREAVTTGNVDFDIANDLLTALDLEPLPRWWTVEVTVAVTVSVPAVDDDDATDAARDALETLLDRAEGIDGYTVGTAGNALADNLADDISEQRTGQR